MTCHVTWLDNPLRVTVCDSRLSKITGFPEFPGYFVPYIRGGMRAAVFRAGGGGNIVIS